MRLFATVLSLLILASGVGHSENNDIPDLRVVGVYRPLGLEGRTVADAREVYLQVTDEAVSAHSYLGRTCTVYRLANVPISAKMDGQELKDLRRAELEVGFDDRASPWAGASTSGVRETNQSMNRIGVRQIEPTKERPRTVDGRPPAFSNVNRRKGNFQNIISLGPGKPALDQVDAVERDDDVEASMEVEVGQLIIIAVRDDMLIGQVRSDGLNGLKAARKGPSALYDVIMTGDYAFLDPLVQDQSKTMKKTPKARKELIAERNLVEKELKRRRKKTVPYRRRIMKWDL